MVLLPLPVFALFNDGNVLGIARLYIMFLGVNSFAIMIINMKFFEYFGNERSQRSRKIDFLAIIAVLFASVLFLSAFSRDKVEDEWRKLDDIETLSANLFLNKLFLSPEKSAIDVLYESFDLHSLSGDYNNAGERILLNFNEKNSSYKVYVLPLSKDVRMYFFEQNEGDVNHLMAVGKYKE